MAAGFVYQLENTSNRREDSQIRLFLDRPARFRLGVAAGGQGGSRFLGVVGGGRAQRGARQGPGSDARTPEIPRTRCPQPRSRSRRQRGRAPVPAPPLRIAQNRLYDHSRFPGCGGPDPVAFVQHMAASHAIACPARYDGHEALPRLGPERSSLHDATITLRIPPHSYVRRSPAAVERCGPARARVRGLPGDQALPAPAAAMGGNRSPACGAVRPAGRRAPRGPGRGARSRTRPVREACWGGDSSRLRGEDPRR